MSQPNLKRKFGYKPYVCPGVNYTHTETNKRIVLSTVLYYITYINTLHEYIKV
jgi:hypothetical protein